MTDVARWAIDALQALAAGLGTWGVLLYTRQRRLRKAELDRDTVSVYQQISESNNDLLTRQNERIVQLETRMAEVHDLLARMVECKHYAHCPGRVRLYQYQRKYFNAPARQPGMESKGFRYPRDNPVGRGPDGDPAGKPP